MREIWEHPFGNAHLKIDRANQHIAAIDSRLRASSNTYGPSLQVNGTTGERSLFYSLTDRTLRSDIALIVGDAIHNLRCALDFAWRGVIERVSPSALNAWTKFPVTDTRTTLIGHLKKTGKIDPASELFDFMVERVKSYKEGDGDIYAIHRMDIDDKHELLIHLLAVVGVEGVELEHEDGSITRYTIMLDHPNSYRTQVPLHSKFKSHGEVKFEITFGVGTLPEGHEIVPTLKRFSAKTLKIVRKLHRMR